MIGHHNLSKDVAWAVNRMRATFVDDIGNAPVVVEGTGFWMQTVEGHTLFVTNRHLVDPSLGPPDWRGFHLDRFEIAIRVRPTDTDLVYHPGDFLTCSNVHSALFMMEWDVAVLVDPVFAERDPERHRLPPMIAEAELADRDWFQRTQGMMDECFFIGFPGTPQARSRTGRAVRRPPRVQTRGPTAVQ